jgi:alkanesulfonate monooxygenase SsuD/methylene tetrahydromethanopterin reductase-like flavin-dependent oxidoreductase (luciferase family)
MRIGFNSMNNASGIHPAELATLLEDRGFDSLWIGEHNHLPATGRTPYPATGGDPPEPYKHMMDLITSMAMAAHATTKLRIGSGVMLVLERIVLSAAKEISTLDVLSNGRIDVGVGVGWNSEFHGEFINFDAVYSYPKPLQRPHPPIWFGGTGRLGLSHVARWADGWFPIDMGERDFAIKLGWLDRALEAAGREPGSIPVSVMVWPGLEVNFDRYQELGIKSVVVGPSNEGEWTRDHMMRCLDANASLVERFKD